MLSQVGQHSEVLKKKKKKKNTAWSRTLEGEGKSQKWLTLEFGCALIPWCSDQKQEQSTKVFKLELAAILALARADKQRLFLFLNTVTMNDISHMLWTL